VRAIKKNRCGTAASLVADAVGCERVSKANNREFFEYFGPKQASAELMAVRYSKFDSDSS